ncbi:hypothetical protein D3C75_1219810 [compost metagenome]
MMLQAALVMRREIPGVFNLAVDHADFGRPDGFCHVHQQQAFQFDDPFCCVLQLRFHQFASCCGAAGIGIQ